MKNRWICLLVALFLFTALPVGAETNQPAVTLTVEDTEVPLGKDMVEVTITYDTTELLLDGGFIITFPTDKLELVVGEKNLPFSDPANDFTTLPNGTVNVQNKEAGWIRVAFIKASGLHGQGVIAKLPFRILDPSVEAEYEISVRAERLVKWVADYSQGENLVTANTPIEDTGCIAVGVDSQTTTSVVTTESPTTTTAQTTTSIPATEATTTTTSTVTTTVPTTSSEIATTTELPTSTQPAKATEAATETTETAPFPWWIVLLAVAVAGLAVLIPLTIKLRKK